MNELGIYGIDLFLRGTAAVAAVFVLERGFRLRLAGRNTAWCWYLLLVCLLFPAGTFRRLFPDAIPAIPAPAAMLTRLIPESLHTAASFSPVPPVPVPGTSNSSPAPADTDPAARTDKFLMKPEHLPGVLAAFLLFGGTILFGLRLRRLSRSRKRFSGEEIHDPRLLRLWQEARKPFRFRREVALRDCSGFCGTPFSAGLFRPRVFFPAERVRECSDRAITLLFSHELVHLQRWDPGKHLFFYLLESFFWFDPGFRLCRRRLIECREYDCDESVTRLPGFSACDRKEYAGELIAFAAGERGTFPADVPFSSSVHELKQRIRELTMKRSSRNFRTLLLCVVAAGALLAGCLTPLAPSSASGDPADRIDLVLLEQPECDLKVEIVPLLDPAKPEKERLQMALRITVDGKLLMEEINGDDFYLSYCRNYYLPEIELTVQPEQFPLIKCGGGTIMMSRLTLNGKGLVDWKVWLSYQRIEERNGRFRQSVYITEQNVKDLIPGQRFTLPLTVSRPKIVERACRKPAVRLPIDPFRPEPGRNPKGTFDDLTFSVTAAEKRGPGEYDIHVTLYRDEKILAATDLPLGTGTKRGYFSTRPEGFLDLATVRDCFRQYDESEAPLKFYVTVSGSATPAGTDRVNLKIDWGWSWMQLIHLDKAVCPKEYYENDPELSELDWVPVSIGGGGGITPHEYPNLKLGEVIHLRKLEQQSLDRYFPEP